MSDAVGWCTANDVAYPGDGSNNYQSVHCAGEHWLWHVGQFFILIAYCCGYISIAHTTKRYMYVQCFRGFLVFASCLLLIWADLIGQSLDGVIYYSIFLFVNFVHLIIVVFYEKTIEFDEHLDTLWGKMFSEDGYNLEALDFYNLVQEKAFMAKYRSGMTYIEEGDIPSKLSILLTGKMEIYKNDSYQRKTVLMSHHSTANERKMEEQKIGSHDSFCGFVYPHEFIDSFEWLMGQGTYSNSSINGGQDDHKSQVTIRCAMDVDECMVLTWTKEMLESVFKEHPRSRTCIHALVGKDVAEKMLRVTGHSIKKLAPDVHMVRKARGELHHKMGAGTFPQGKTSFDLHSGARSDASELAAEIFDKTQEYHNCGGGKYTYWEGIIVARLGDGKVAVEWMRSPEALADDEVEQEDKAAHLAGAGTYRQSSSCDVADLRLLHPGYTNYDLEGIPTHRAPVNGEEPARLTRSEQTELQDQMECGVGFVHERFTDHKDLTVREADIPVECGTVVSRVILLVHNMSDKQREIKQLVGAGPWCELPDRVLSAAPWTNITHYCNNPDGNCRGDCSDKNEGQTPQYGVPKQEGKASMNYHLLEQAKHGLQRARLRVTNSRLLGLNPGCLESLQPSSDTAEQDTQNGDQLHRYFHDNCPNLQKKDLHEILKWGKWRNYYRPGTSLVRQGEEAHYVGIILQGRLALYTEDEITRNKNLVTYAEKFDLVGSEDFSSKFRTARRTIMLPKYHDPKDWAENHPGEIPPQVLPLHQDTEAPTDPKNREAWSASSMYKSFSLKPAYRSTATYHDILDAGDDALDKLGDDGENALSELTIYIRDMVFRDGDRTYLEERMKAALDQGEEEMLVTTIPAVLFQWDIKDLKRLMLADPKVEAALSSLLRSDITYKLNNSSKSALATRMCGMSVGARGDTDVSCAPSCGAGGDL